MGKSAQDKDSKHKGDPKNLFFFVHIPKTGGKYVRASLHRGDPHVKDNIPVFIKIGGTHTWYEDTILNKRTIPGYKSITSTHHTISVIRNPFDLLVSYHMMNSGRVFSGRRRKIPKIANGWNNCNRIHKIKSFEQFLEHYCDENFIWHAPALQQNLFSQIYDTEGRVVVDTVLRYENNFMEELDAFAATHGLQHHRSSPINVTPGKVQCYRGYYTTRLVDLVNAKCTKELKAFGYSYE